MIGTDLEGVRGWVATTPVDRIRAVVISVERVDDLPGLLVDLPQACRGAAGGR